MSKTAHARFGSLQAFALFFLAVQALQRTALLAATAPDLDLAPGLVARIYAVGLVYDVVALLWLVLPASLYLLLVSERWRGGLVHGLLAWIALATGAFLTLFAAVAEWFFWDEFQSRFNFIAVDYLIYTREVIEDIWQSYPVAPLVLAIGTAAAATAFGLQRGRPGWTAAAGPRLVHAVILLGVPLAAFVALERSSLPVSGDQRYANELAGNGIYGFMAAFRSSQLDYSTFYRTADEDTVLRGLRSALEVPGTRFRSKTLRDLTRKVEGPGPEQRLNVMMIVVESLSAKYLGVFGSERGLTPELDRIAGESLLFGNLYATGNRTVRGIEAITLSVPPTPGESIVKRPDYAGMFSLGFLFRERGYDTRFIYGGYGYFDNMNAFFGANGFAVVDRTSLSEDETGFANAWGVADEYLFHRALREADGSYAAGQPFFSFVLTTSNHRPFTYPEGRIAIPSGTGRYGGVRYTDFAIGDFLRRARERPWFDDTLFVIVADHCAGTSGRIDLPLERYHIPLIIYAPRHVEPRRVDTLASQIDLGPTVLGLLGFSYETRFFGRDVLRAGDLPPRALIATYEKLGLLQPELLTILSPNRRIHFQSVPEQKPLEPAAARAHAAELHAVAFYQGQSLAYDQRLGRWEPPAEPGSQAAAAR